MQIIRTILWVALTAILVAFIAMNWDPAAVNFWPLQDGYLHFIWPIGIVALVFFLLGLLPMYLVHRTTRWRLQRRISSLENTAAANAAVLSPMNNPAAHTAPLATSAQLDAEAMRAEARHGTI